VADERATITIANEGPLIEESRLKDIFEYGVSLAPRSTRANQGQGLFVAAEFVAKMLGTINARNLKDGVAFDITIPLARVSVPNDKAAT
jgi:signal transduction histidine kinase